MIVWGNIAGIILRRAGMAGELRGNSHQIPGTTLPEAGAMQMVAAGMEAFDPSRLEVTGDGTPPGLAVRPLSLPELLRMMVVSAPEGQRNRRQCNRQAYQRRLCPRPIR